MNYTCTILHSA